MCLLYKKVSWPSICLHEHEKKKIEQLKKVSVCVIRLDSRKWCGLVVATSLWRECVVFSWCKFGRRM